MRHTSIGDPNQNKPQPKCTTRNSTMKGAEHFEDPGVDGE